MTVSYLDLLQSDGSVNRDVFAAILASRVTAEINLRLCQAAGIRQPRGLSLDGARIWRAGVAATIDQSLVGPDERKRVEGYERAELEVWCAEMQLAAEKQRIAMTPVLVAAE
jgi:hypothetical protein